MDLLPTHAIPIYRDVLIHIQRAGEQGYPAVLTASGGETFDWMIETMPELRDVALVNDAANQKPETVSLWLYTLGCTLFNTLREGISQTLADWLAHLCEGQQGLRLRLWIDDPRVAALPWEFLHHTHTREWLLQSPGFSLVRSHLNATDLESVGAYAINPATAAAFFAHMHQLLHRGNDFESSFNAWRRAGEFDRAWFRGLPMLLESPTGAPELALFWLQPVSGEPAPRLVVLSSDDFWRYASLEAYLSASAQTDIAATKDVLEPDLGDFSRPAWGRDNQPRENQPIEKEFGWDSPDLDELLNGGDWEAYPDNPDELIDVPSLGWHEETAPVSDREVTQQPVIRGDPSAGESTPATPLDIHAENSQGFVNNPSGPVNQNFGTQYNLNGTVINMPPPPNRVIGSLDLRLDTAVPEQVYLNEPFKLAVSIRLPTSPALDLPGLPGHFNEPFEADELENVALVFRIEVQESSDYRMVGPTFHIVRYRKGKESPAFYFELVPLHLGSMEIVINVLQETANIGAMRIMTTAFDPALKTRGQVAAQVQVVESTGSARTASEPSRLADVEDTLHNLVELLVLPENRPYIDQLVAYLCLEARRGEQANAARAQQIFTDLRSGAPEICRAAAGAFHLPVRGVGRMFCQIAEGEFQRGHN